MFLESRYTQSGPNIQTAPRIITCMGPRRDSFFFLASLVLHNPPADCGTRTQWRQTGRAATHRLRQHTEQPGKGELVVLLCCSNSKTIKSTSPPQRALLAVYTFAEKGVKNGAVRPAVCTFEHKA